MGRYGLNNNNINTNQISLENLGPVTYRIHWYVGNKRHVRHLNPNSMAQLLRRHIPNITNNNKIINARLRAIPAGEIVFKNPFTRSNVRRNQITKNNYSNARQSPARRSPARRSTLNRARSAGRAAGLYAGRTGLAAARMAYGAATAAYRRMTEPTAATRQRQRNNQAARIRSLPGMMRQNIWMR